MNHEDTKNTKRKKEKPYLLKCGYPGGGCSMRAMLEGIFVFFVPFVVRLFFK